MILFDCAGPVNRGTSFVNNIGLPTILKRGKISTAFAEFSVRRAIFARNQFPALVIPEDASAPAELAAWPRPRKQFARVKFRLPFA
jgi:hypothetical protein